MTASTTPDVPYQPALTVSTASAVTCSVWTTTIVVANFSGVTVNVLTTGVAATSTTGYALANGQTGAFENCQVLPNNNLNNTGSAVATFYDGKMDTGGVAAPANPFLASATQSQNLATIWNVQTAYGNTAQYAGAYPGYCSVYVYSGYTAGTVTVTFQ